MPTSAPHPCPAKGCRALVHGRGACPAHARKAWNHHGMTRQARGYGAQHDRIRAQVMREEQGCAECGDQGPGSADHTVPVSQGGQTTRENMRRLCVAHQQAKASREGNAARRAHGVGRGSKS